MIDKQPNKNLRKYYTIFLEIGIILSLLIFIAAVKIEMPTQKNNQDMVEEQEVVKMKEVVQTKQQKTPPAPPKPQTPVEVPNDEVVEEQDFNLDAELNMDQQLEMPEPPDEAEEEGNEEEEVFVVVENQPKLRGGLASLQKKIKYPEMARKAGIEGRVYVQFVVNKKGNVENPRVMRGIGGGCDKEALRVIKQAKFQPGMQRGRPVKVQMSLPIVFRLQK